MFQKNNEFNFRSILGDIQTNIGAKYISNTLSSRVTAYKLLHRTVADFLNLVRVNSSFVKTQFAYDGDNKRGVHNMIKCSSFCDLMNEGLVT